MQESSTVEAVRSLLKSTQISWDWFSPEAQNAVIKILGARTEAKAIERLSIIESINKALPEASRCVYTPIQEERVQGLPYAVQKVKCIKAKVEPNYAANELLYFYRDCWKRFEKWERSQQHETQTDLVSSVDSTSSVKIRTSSGEIIEWVQGSRAIYKDKECQVIKIGMAGAYKNKAKVKLDSKEQWVYLTQLTTCAIAQEILPTPVEPETQWQKGDRIMSPGGAGTITNIDMTRRVPYFTEWDDGGCGWYGTDKSVRWTKLENSCSSLTNSSAELADLAKQSSSLEASQSETTLISTPTPKLSTDTITQASAFTQISELSTQTEEQTSSFVVSPAPAQAKPEVEQDSTTQNQDSGLKPCDASLKDDPSLLLSKIQKGLSTEDLDQYLPPSEWSDIAGTIRSLYRRLGSALRTAETGYLLLPTPTSYSEGSVTVRPAGQNKLEQTLRLLPSPVAADASTAELLTSNMKFRITKTGTPRKISGNGADGSVGLSRLLMLTPTPEQPFIKTGDKLSPLAAGWMMGFRPGYAEEVLMDGGGITQLPSTLECLPIPKDAEPVSSSTVEPSSLSKPRSRSAESSISTHSSKPPTEPFLKWAGGKTWAVELVKEIYAPFKDYRLVSLTLGGGAIELGLQPERALLCDINPYLINCWKWVKENGEFSIPLESREEYFKEIRDRFNENPLHPDAAQWFYLLNHTGFNGLQRGSSKKHFNVGFGKYRKFHGQTDLVHYKTVMKAWEFKAQPWEQTLLEIQEDDFLIFDPPYHGTGFKEYYGKFTDDDQMFAAAGLGRLLNPVVAFNAATPEMLELYQDLGFDVEVKEVARSISCTGDRTPAKEMIATKNLRRQKEQKILSFLERSKNNYPAQDNSPTTRKRSKNKVQASGSLSKVGGKTLKDGTKTERWLFSYSEKVGDKWRCVKRHVPNGKVARVKDAIADKKGYEYICQSILSQPSTPSD